MMRNLKPAISNDLEFVIRICAMPFKKEVEADLQVEEQNLSNCEIKAKKVQITLPNDGYVQFSNASIQSTTGTIEIEGMSVTHPVLKRYLSHIGISVQNDPATNIVTLKAEQKSVVLTKLELKKIKAACEQRTDTYSDEYYGHSMVMARKYHPAVIKGIVSGLIGGIHIIQKTDLLFMTQLFGDNLYRIENGHFTLNGLDLMDQRFRDFLTTKGCEFLLIVENQGQTNESKVLIFASNHLKITCQDLAQFKQVDFAAETLAMMANIAEGVVRTPQEQAEAAAEDARFETQRREFIERERQNPTPATLAAIALVREQAQRRCESAREEMLNQYKSATREKTPEQKPERTQDSALAARPCRNLDEDDDFIRRTIGSF